MLRTSICAAALLALFACDEGADAPGTADAAAPDADAAQPDLGPVELETGFYDLVDHALGPCGQPQPVGDCPDCLLDQPIMQVEITDPLAGDTIDTVHLKLCSRATPSSCTSLGVVGDGWRAGPARQRTEDIEGACRVTDQAVGLRMGPAGVEVVVASLALELEGPCGWIYRMDDATCEREEVARLVPRP